MGQVISFVYERPETAFTHCVGFEGLIGKCFLYLGSQKLIKTVFQRWSTVASFSTACSFPETTNFPFWPQDRERSLGAWGPVLHIYSQSSQHLDSEGIHEIMSLWYHMLENIAPWCMPMIFSTECCSLGTQICCRQYRVDGRQQRGLPPP